jgi:hypothetical protein
MMTSHVSSVRLTNALKVLYKVISLMQTITSASITASSEKIDVTDTSIAVFNRNSCSNFFLLLCPHISLMLYCPSISVGSSSCTVIDELAAQTGCFLTRGPNSAVWTEAEFTPGVDSVHVNS